MWLSLDRPKESCGIVGIYGHPEAAKLAYLCLYALQHRGQESAGIVSSDGERVYKHLGMGLVADVFSDVSTLERLKGHIAIGHNRYSTTGSSQATNIQPILVNCKDGPLAVSHNGNLINSNSLRRSLTQQGSLFQTTTDSEVIVHLVAKSPEYTVLDRIMDALTTVKGAYSLVFLTRDKLIAVRDPNGFRPLSLGTLAGAYVVVSESCALDLIGAQYVRDLEPGEIISIDENGLSSFKLEGEINYTYCIFELIYFSRPDSKFLGEYVDKTRRKFGKNLALEKPADADIVVAVPDSSNTAALGYSHQSGIKFEIGLIRNHYIGRTFIHPSQSMRDFNVRIKFNPVGGVLNDKRVVVVEDSIVRGTTLKQLTRMIRRAGAKEVHVRVSCPPIRFPCFYGMDFPTKKEVIASSHTVEEIREFLDVDSLGYLSMEGLLNSVPKETCGYCTACFDGNYPLPVEEEIRKDQHDRELSTVEV